MSDVAQVSLDADVGVGIPSLCLRLATGAFTGFDDSVSALLSLGCGPYLSTQSHVLYQRSSSGPSAHCSSFASGYDANEEANVHVYADIATGHVDVRTSAVMVDINVVDDDNNADDSVSADTLGEILDALFLASQALDLDGAFHAMNSTIDFTPSPPTSSTSSSAAGEPT